MFEYFQRLWQAARALPVYAALATLSLTAFAWAGLRGYRLLGDDNETEEAPSSPAGRRGGGHGGTARFYHK